MRFDVIRNPLDALLITKGQLKFPLLTMVAQDFLRMLFVRLGEQLLGSTMGAGHQVAPGRGRIVRHLATGKAIEGDSHVD
jgi:hypothetical protein